MERILHQMAHAIRSVDLEPMLAQVSQRYLLQLIVYAYLRAKIPLILGVGLYDERTPNVFTPIGKHAIAVAGYNLGGPTHLIGTTLQLTASRIDKIYAHDDQIGPFARMELTGSVIVERDGKQFTVDALTTSWQSASTTGKVFAVPDMLLCPMYHKVRIEWKWVLLAVTEFYLFLTQLSRTTPIDVASVEWDVYLSNVNDVKSDYANRAALTSDRRFSLLTQPMPRFLWRATGRRGTEDAIDIVFDATDIETGQVVVSALVFDDLLLQLLREMALHPSFAGAPIKRIARKIIQKIIE
jgi:hypothetical protein